MEQQNIKVVCIGAAVQDVFLQGKIFAAHKDEDGDSVQEFELGTKNEVEDITISTGGGATNAAVTFARQGLHSMYMGRIGHDVSGDIVLDSLHKEGVDTSLVSYNEKLRTGYSTIMLSPKGERTILTYRGASKHYDLQESDFEDVRSDWFYISSLSGDFAALKTIVKYAQAHDIKIAINPGKGELSHSHAFRDLLQAFTILSLNKEEMQLLSGKENIGSSMQKIVSKVPIVLVTDGPKGSVACDGEKLYKAGMYKDVPVIDRAGAGDAFSSGFVAMIAQGENLERALTFASANSTSVVSKIGAKTGILSEGAKLHQMQVEVLSLH